MKKQFLTLFVLLPIFSFGQSLFFDNLNTTTWSSQIEISDSTLLHSDQISLDKMNYPTIPTKGKITIWKFREGLLTIENYTDKSLEESSSRRYLFTVYDDNILSIMIDDCTSVAFTVGIVSTGYHALLIKQNKKKTSN